MEELVSDQMRERLSKNNIHCEAQHRFVSGRYCAFNLFIV